MVLGVRVHGDTVTDHEVKLDSLFREVPVPTKLGVPVMYKLMPGTGGDDSHIRSSIIVRFMADPDDGFAPAVWQYGGKMGPAPPVVLARRDKVPFSKHDWESMNDYMSQWLDELGDAEDERQQVSERLLTPEALQAHVRTRREEQPLAFLSLQFPAGCTVVPEGLSAQELNGREGEVVQYSRERVGVRFPDRDVTALRPERLRLERQAPRPEQPDPKRRDTGGGKDQREARARQIASQEARQIAKRFCECLGEDTFPEMDDLHLFGVGCDYRTRAQEVLAVWQGAVKAERLSEEELAQALEAGTVSALFEKTCRSLATSTTPNATYAQELIKNNFAALEWDTL